MVGGTDLQCRGQRRKSHLKTKRLVFAYWTKILKMDSVSKARTRLGRYPVLLAACAPQAAAYGKCVGEALGEVQKNQCATQFQDFMKCVKQEAKRLGTRL